MFRRLAQGLPTTLGCHHMFIKLNLGIVPQTDQTQNSDLEENNIKILVLKRLKEKFMQNSFNFLAVGNFQCRFLFFLCSCYKIPQKIEIFCIRSLRQFCFSIIIIKFRSSMENQYCPLSPQKKIRSIYFPLLFYQTLMINQKYKQEINPR
jgi:hypothetical protein